MKEVYGFWRRFYIVFEIFICLFYYLVYKLSRVHRNASFCSENDAVGHVQVMHGICDTLCTWVWGGICFLIFIAFFVESNTSFDSSPYLPSSISQNLLECFLSPNSTVSPLNSSRIDFSWNRKSCVRTQFTCVRENQNWKFPWIH